jgi:DNA-binding NtrC family response regulator
MNPKPKNSTKDGQGGCPINGTDISIHIVDDDLSVREAVGCLIRSAGWKVETFASAEEFLRTSQKNIPRCLVLDVDLPGLDGLDLQEELAKTNVQIPIVFLTGHGDIPMTVRALKAGAMDFLTKPVNGEDLLGAIRKELAHSNLGRKSNERDGFEEIIGSSPMLMRVLEQIRTVGPTDSTVLILGETGTGKELIARAIHKRSKRFGHAFVSVNCASIPRDLIASELFGHEKGAFTGALQLRQGCFERAESGTIFLDEIGELPAEMQIALLRVLQEREFERVGGNRVIRADVRVIAATNRHLSAAITAGTFRADLFYRLNVVPIEAPPLRKRKEDIPMLVEYFVERFAERTGKHFSGIDNRSRELCQKYDWPGNIRELQNIIERSVVLCNGDMFWIDESWLSSQETPRPETAGALTETLQNQERNIIEAALAESRGKVGGINGAATRLGIPPSTLDSKIKQLNIEKRKFLIAS